MYSDAARNSSTLHETEVPSLEMAINDGAGSSSNDTINSGSGRNDVNNTIGGPRRASTNSPSNIQHNAQARVRFSLDTNDRPSSAVISQSSRRASIRDTIQDVSIQEQPGGSQARSEMNSHSISGTAGPSPIPSRMQLSNRNRGYSLRRSLFAQSMENKSSEHGAAIELTHSPISEASSSFSASLDKQTKAPTVSTVETPEERESDLSRKHVRLSDPAFNLPLYTEWVKRQGSKPGIFKQKVNDRLELIWKRIVNAKEIPPSVDGRHVRLNLDKSFLTIDERTQHPYVGNSIRSCRYTPLNFVPRQLWAQFGKLANFYFLCVSLLQMVPGLSTTGTYTTIIPLLIFVSISMAKEGYEDLRRYRLDKEENERKTLVLDSRAVSHSKSAEYKSRTGSQDSDETLSDVWRVEQWQKVRVGDVILLKRNEPVPADVIVLHSSDPTNAAYIETKSLDGETNLKTKKPLPPVADMCKDEEGTARLNAEFVVEDPNLDLYKFDGRVTVNGETLPLTNNEVVYRGSILRNTQHMFGLVIYSGEECKIRMNANKNPRVKAPALQARVNRVVVIVASLVFFIATILTFLNLGFRKHGERQAFYLKRASVPFGHILTSFVIMFNTMLPLSLYVSLEIVKVCQIWFMNDVDMYDPESDIPMEARTSTINEELGQVSYIFSDKTGTLTNNSMRFRKISVAGTAWLHDLDVQEAAAKANGQKLLHKKRGDKGKATKKKQNEPRKSGFSTYSASGRARPSVVSAEWQPTTRAAASLHCGRTEEMLEYIYHRPNSVFARKAKFFILGLALCHTCLPEKDDEGNITFQAASPDELALVTAAQELGYIVTDRQTNTITVKTFVNGDEDEVTYDTYEILDVIEFSSARKRMSIIMRLPDSRICIFTKGADTTIRKLLRLNDLAEANVVEIDRRASIRKSMEVSEVLRRKSIHVALERQGRTSISAAPGSTIVGRKSSVSMGHTRTVRESIDAWLTERETDVDMSVPRRSNAFYTPRPSAQISSTLTGDDTRQSLSSINDPRDSFQTDDMEMVIDESVVINDHAIFERCFQHIDDFATEGLRTLLYGYRYLTEDEYTNWKLKFHEASTSLADRQEKIEKVGDLIENQFELLGATAIEDKLQDGVPDAIERFRRAGIKMWMLTGDKRETAINIGHSCRLIKDYSTTIILDHENGDLPARMAAAVADIQNQRTAHSVLVVDGQTLMFIDTDTATRALFTDLAIAADSVICCRASPSQKAALVKTIRLKVKGSVTLAIGDGANDIAMIQEAHLGIGIAGKEGLQAARTSDYSIAQFRFLLKLLLVHGRWNYVRVCKYTLGTFWKEMIFYIVQALYQRWNGYTGTSLYEPWSMSMFNTLFTSLPVIFIGIFEKDLGASTLLAVPELYAIGRLNRGFNIWIYAWWAFMGSIEAIVIFFTTFSIYGQAMFTKNNSLYAMGSLAFTCCVIMVSFKLQFFELHNKSITAGIAIFLSTGAWWLWNMLMSALYPTTGVVYNVHRTFLYSFGRNILWWLTVIIIIMGLSMLEILLKVIKSMVSPSDTELFQAYERDIDIKKRFEESAADLLQQGWNRGSKKSSIELAREETLKAEQEADQERREAEIEEMLNRPRAMDDDDDIAPDSKVRRRHSGYTDDPQGAFKIGGERHEPATPKRSLDVSELFNTELFNKGFGKVKKESLR